MKRVLIISYYWPPTGGSGVQRWVKFTKYLPSYGWQPVIYTPENPEMLAVDESLAAEIPQQAEVIKTHIFEPYEIYRKLLGKKKGGKNGAKEVNPINAGPKSFAQKLALFVRGNFFIPDPRCFWIGPSVKYLRHYLKEHPVDVIVSTGPPQSMHLIAMPLAKEFNIPWVADFRDPWTKMFYFKHLGLTAFSRKRHEILEKRVLDRASAVVAVSPLVRDEFLQMTNTPVELITNGFDQSDFPGVEPDGFFNITHTGLFAADGIPDVLWKVLAEKAAADQEFARKLRIRLVGKTDREVIQSIIDAGLEDKLIDLGYQAHKDAVIEQRRASVLLLPLRKEPEYKAVLPGKLFEYLAASHAILGIGQSDGAMAAILRETHTGETVEWNDKEAMREFIDKLWKAFLVGEDPYKPEDIERFSRNKLTAAMTALFDKLLNNE
ncbi:MAG: glycosyltransferase [Bacteroidales bacterium]|nr:glycosyltransferase [Bacteroidales bacterium]